MINIYDRSESLRAIRLRDMFLHWCIPCAVKTLNTEALASTAHVHVFFIDQIDIYEFNIKFLDPESVLFCDGDVCEFDRESHRIFVRATDILDVKFGINPDSFFSGTFSDVNGKQRYYGRHIHFTEKERLILKHLSVRAGEWCTSQEIGEYCFGNECSKHTASTHVNNINAKTLESTGRRSIETNRKLGYRFIINKPAVLI